MHVGHKAAVLVQTLSIRINLRVTRAVATTVANHGIGAYLAVEGMDLVFIGKSCRCGGPRNEFFDNHLHGRRGETAEICHDLTRMLRKI